MSDEENFENDDDVEELEGDDAGYSAASDDYDDSGASIMRESLRLQLQSDVEAFLARGGSISEIPANVVSDPPKKPQSNYGGQPI